MLGKSYGGRDIAGMIVNNPDTGPDTSKPAMYIEANIHGNEIQGGEICIYTIWYLMENYGKIDQITKLVNERAFYIVPTVNPDGRDYFMHGPGGNARSGHMPVDDDNDYQFDEDGPEDLNGNGIIEQIRKYVPGQGNYKKSAVDPRIMEPVKPGEVGDYIMLGQEGIDHDGDGRVGEDGPGSYDPNRNFASRLAAELHPERRDGLPVPAAGGEGGQRLLDVAPEHRGPADLPQQRRDDPAEPGRGDGRANTRRPTCGRTTNWAETPSASSPSTATW